MTLEEHKMLKNIEQKAENIEALLAALIGGLVICYLVWIFS